MESERVSDNTRQSPVTAISLFLIVFQLSPTGQRNTRRRMLQVLHQFIGGSDEQAELSDVSEKSTTDVST